MNVFGYLQKVGQALMIPIACLPAAAILMGVGYWVDPNGWGHDNAFAALLIKAGGAILKNIPLLFAVGIAFGMSKDRDGSAALSGLVCWLVVMVLLDPASIAIIQGIDISDVPAAFDKADNQFVAIVVGIIASVLYNRYSETQLPKALSFFNGKRLVPILAAVAGIAIAGLFMQIWSGLFTGMTNFGTWMYNQGAIGSGLFGFFNRLLIPTGLHHAINPVFWYDVAGINDMPNFLGGAQSIAEGRAEIGVTGRYMAGFFPVLMFGLPAAGLAMYVTAKKQNKARVASLMVAAAFASFFTGVSEPMEFAFMFAAPALYILHSVFMGISMYIASSMGWISGFGFSAGFIDLVLQSHNPLATQWYMLIPLGLCFAVIYFVTFRWVILKFNLKTVGREDEDEEAQEYNSAPLPSSELELAHSYVAALGGKDNLTEINACITRLRLSVKDKDLVNDKKIKALGSLGIVHVGEKNMQIIVGTQAESISLLMKTV
ncbi:N-acetylglucosamine-specific PTS transporter subunit IIBC [Vibrio kyushuensis]|uniref:N-acetylglucosamine-specific PTS transporter subunit IIBC n=1 Tax=Vibrio kyushuensis TaxID=2910249 RepID=UPI003D12958F